MDLIDRRAFRALPSILAIKLNGSGLGVSPQGRGLSPPRLICTPVSSICIQYRGFTSLYKLEGLAYSGPVSISFTGGLPVGPRVDPDDVKSLYERGYNEASCAGIVILANPCPMRVKASPICRM